MEFKAIITDITGNHEVTLGMDLYKSPNGFSAEFNSRHPTAAGMPTASDQLYAQCGLFRTNDITHGIRSAKVRDILEGMSGIALDAATAPGNVGISRFVAPAAILDAIQNDMYEDRSGVLGQFRIWWLSRRACRATATSVLGSTTIRRGTAVQSRLLSWLNRPTSVC